MAVISQIKASDNIDYNIRDDYSIWSGRNLLQGTANLLESTTTFDAPTWRISSGGNGVGTIATINDSPIQLNKVLRITGNTSGNRDWDQTVQDFADKGTSGSWICSCWVRAIGSPCKSYIRVWSSKAIFTKTTNSIPTTWTKLEFPLTLSDNCTSGRLMFGTTGQGSIEYIGMKLERGNKATDWSPAPEDLARFIGNETIELYSE